MIISTRNSVYNSVDKELYQSFRTSSLSFISKTFGESHPYYKEFDKSVNDNSPTEVKEGRGILNAIKQEIEGGWMFTIKGLVSAEIFSDFLEMAGYLLEQGYKDPAAVMIGSVLEEHLRQLCLKNGIETTIHSKDGKEIHKKADRMNNDLVGADIYNKLYQKSVTGWLDLRNKAAHGEYTEYDKLQVHLMEAGVTDFIAKTA
ncbi:hypothetical protein [Hymenobacter sp. NBH84]|uniref:hypothetical protein n=1 Tax=Hymenobacter sp. NBH84 TaxID=2596915 RepID=UPI0021564F63|nr:hypothetical protein [Hymenobacter sp. NBH84]